MEYLFYLPCAIEAAGRIGAAGQSLRDPLPPPPRSTAGREEDNRLVRGGEPCRPLLAPSAVADFQADSNRGCRSPAKPSAHISKIIVSRYHASARSNW